MKCNEIDTFYSIPCCACLRHNRKTLHYVKSAVKNFSVCAEKTSVYKRKWLFKKRLLRTLRTTKSEVGRHLNARWAIHDSVDVSSVGRISIRFQSLAKKAKKLEGIPSRANGGASKRNV